MKALRLTANAIVAAGIVGVAIVLLNAIFLLNLRLCAAVAQAPVQKAADPTGQPQRVTVILRSVERLPNRSGANCGYHYDLAVDVVGRGWLLLHVYDMGVPEDDLVALKGRKVEINFVTGGIVESIRAVGGGAGNAAALSDLSTIKYC